METGLLPTSMEVGGSFHGSTCQQVEVLMEEDESAG